MAFRSHRRQQPARSEKMMDLRQLRSFLAVIDHGSFSA
ncbi:MAG: hypothetical protein ACI88C_001644, partial [Acidimicrobiales bacterium]